jgi:hypothetical protein
MRRVCSLYAHSIVSHSTCPESTTTRSIHRHPTYFAALLFKRMVNAAHVLNVTANTTGGGGAGAVHVYGFRPTRANAKGETIFLAINLNRTVFASLHLPSSIVCASLAVYELTASGNPAPGGDRMLNAPNMSLNGVTLALTADGALPQLTPRQAPCEVPVDLRPLSAVLMVVTPPRV